MSKHPCAIVPGVGMPGPLKKDVFDSAAIIGLRPIGEGSIDFAMNDSEPVPIAVDIPDPIEEPGFDLGAVPSPAPVKAAQSTSQATGEAYRVLARAYRPQTFAELIGQDAMVQTLGNAIARDRLAHAFLMTGVRGVGKTSTARLIAKALNCIGPDGDGGPTIDPCGVCSHCTAIAEGRHIDVQEMDAASHTGIDDIREITDAVRYASVSARYKIYIIDEVHMLSKQAFNGLLKTLEEPPPHVKFLFATTEVQKVPVTILSRCQRFDLRRITPDMLTAHFAQILAKEGVAAEDAAVRMIASAAEGSVRDGLSLLDQAIAHSGQSASGGGTAIITAASVSDMLGLSDRSAIRVLFDAMLSGDSGAVIDAVRAQYALGAEPLALVRGIMDLTHAITLVKLSRTADPLLSEGDKASVQDWSLQLGNATLHRMWQLLLKGHQDVIAAPRALEACEMALLRIMHARQMPDPGELAVLLGTGLISGTRAVGTANETAPNRAALVLAPAPIFTPVPDFSPEGAMSAAIADYADAETEKLPAILTAKTMEIAVENQVPGPATPDASAAVTTETLYNMVLAGGHHQVARLFHDHVRVITLNAAQLIYAQTPALGGAYPQQLAQALKSATGQHWQVEAAVADDAAPSLLQIADAAQYDRDMAIRAHPLVDAALKAFPDAHILRDNKDTSSAMLQ